MKGYVATRWAAYEHAVYGGELNGGTDLQRARIELRRAFFTGAQAMLKLIGEMADEAVGGTPEGSHLATLAAISDELEEFGEQIKRGEA